MLDERGADMDEVITLSSDSDGSDAETRGARGRGGFQGDALPLAAVKLDVAAIKVHAPTSYIDLTDPRWAFPELRLRKKEDPANVEMIDLTEKDAPNGTEQDAENLSPSIREYPTPKKLDFNLQISSSREQPVFALQQDCGVLDSNTEAPECVTYLRATPGPNDPRMETPPDGSLPDVTDSLARREQREDVSEFARVRLKAQTPWHQKNPAEPRHLGEGCSVETPRERVPQENEWGDFCASLPFPSPTSPSSFQNKTHGPLQRQGTARADSRCSTPSDHSPPLSPTMGLDPSELFNLDTLSYTSSPSHDPVSGFSPTPTARPEQTEIASECRSEDRAEEPSTSSDHPSGRIPGESPLSVSAPEDMDYGSGPDAYRADLGIDSPPSFLWQEESDEERERGGSPSDLDSRAASREDRRFTCPVALKKFMAGSDQVLIDNEDEGFGAPEVLCRLSLSLVYSTIEESYPEGTLQLLFDLVQPGYYPPRDITVHVLRGILLDPQCPYHLCVQAFNLLIRTQRHHRADKTTVPWDWELLTSIMVSQDQAKRHRCEVVSMLLEYVVRTLEDDFHAKRSTSALHLSIAKATLSCDQKFPRVKQVIKWLFDAIMKSTDPKEGDRERNEHTRMVVIFQRMLSLALEVDRSPALNSAKLSQELFLTLISNISLRAHRMLLLGSLQSKLLRCKLLEHLLDYSCPVKISLPMSLSLLLHFMKYCTLAADPTDGAARWQKWEELVHLLWMLLLSYSKAMNGFLCSSPAEQRGRVGTLVYKQDDKVSKSAVCEAVETLLSRSRADLGQALPCHVEESIFYLQDHLLDVCQC